MWLSVWGLVFDHLDSPETKLLRILHDAMTQLLPKNAMASWMMTEPN